MPKATILFVDNVLEFAEVSARLLEREDYRVIIALTARQAEEILNKGEIDLAIIDQRLMDEDNEYDNSGLNLALKVAPLIPKILQTAYPDSEGAEALGVAHALIKDYISKQQGIAALLTAIDRIIAAHTGLDKITSELSAELDKEFLRQSDQQFEEARGFFDQQLVSLALTKGQIENQSPDELAQSLERVNDAIKFPESFGTLKLRMTSTGIRIADNSGIFHYEIGILPILLEREKLIRDRINLSKVRNHAVIHTKKSKRTLKKMPNTVTSEVTKIKILFLASNPKDTPQLRLDEEMRTIDSALIQTDFRDRFDIKQHWAVRVFDVQSYLLRHRPDIVHFSGHGSSTSEIILEDNTGSSHPISPRALSQLFFVLKDNIRCVVLNACYSEQQAQAIAEHVDCVVGMSRTISDSAAIGFSAAFYQGLGFGRDIKTAFDLGCIEIDLENLGEQSTPKLLALRINPKDLIFASTSKSR